MKKINVILLATLAIIIGFSSCDKFTDIEPKGTVVPNTVAHYAGLLDGDILPQTPISYMLASDDVYIPDNMISNYMPWVIRTYEWKDYQFELGEKDFTWNQAYSEIFICNSVLNNIDNATGDEGERNKAKAHALFNRAFTNFQLVNMYAKVYNPSTASSDLGIPLVKSEEILQSLPRATVEEVYKSIVEDVELSIADLPLTYGSFGSVTSLCEATQRAAYGLLSRVYLFKEEYGKVLEWGEKFFADISYEASISDMNDPSFSPMNYASQEHTYFQLPSVENQFDFINMIGLSDDLLSLFDVSKDFRYHTLTMDMYGVRIWADIFSSMPDAGISTTEVLLNMAEAHARLGHKASAIDLVNILQKKRHLAAAYVPLNGEELSDEEALVEVLNERRRELMITGKRFFDMKRLNKEERFQITINRTVNGSSIQIEPGDNRYQFALPRDIVAMNPNLLQNPR